MSKSVIGCGKVSNRMGGDCVCVRVRVIGARVIKWQVIGSGKVINGYVSVHACECVCVSRQACGQVIDGVSGYMCVCVCVCA